MRIDTLRDEYPSVAAAVMRERESERRREKLRVCD
jgi:hypothetical protein